MSKLALSDKISKIKDPVIKELYTKYNEVYDKTIIDILLALATTIYLYDENLKEVLITDTIEQIRNTLRCRKENVIMAFRTLRDDDFMRFEGFGKKKKYYFYIDEGIAYKLIKTFQPDYHKKIGRLYEDGTIIEKQVFGDDGVQRISLCHVIELMKKIK